MNFDPYYCYVIIKNKGEKYQCKNTKKIGNYCGIHHKTFINRENNSNVNKKQKKIEVFTIEKLEYNPEINLTKQSLSIKEIKEKIKEYNNKKW